MIPVNTTNITSVGRFVELRIDPHIHICIFFKIHPGKFTWNPKSWRFGSDDFPFVFFVVILRFQPLIYRAVYISANFKPCHGQSTYPPNVFLKYLPPRNKALIAGLIKGNQWAFISHNLAPTLGIDKSPRHLVIFSPIFLEAQPWCSPGECQALSLRTPAGVGVVLDDFGWPG